MRFIELDRNGTTYFDAVVKLGCGPSFVRNRADAFEQMIKEQGLKFWFRFWLNFTLHHGIKEFYDVNQDIPGLTASLFKGLHYHFVQASNEEAITYCWNTIFASGAPTKRILDEMYQFLEIGFASALGEVFFKWLYAENVGTHCKKKYWTVPNKYLDPEFKPGFLEVFLLCEWGNKFTELLGVTKTDVPWVRKLLQIPLYLFEDRKGMSLYHMEYTRALVVRKCIESWKLKIKNMRSAIQKADCKKLIDEPFAPKKSKKGHRVRFMLSSASDMYIDAAASNSSSRVPSMINLPLKMPKIESERVQNGCSGVIQNIFTDCSVGDDRPTICELPDVIERSSASMTDCSPVTDQSLTDRPSETQTGNEHRVPVMKNLNDARSAVIQNLNMNNETYLNVVLKTGCGPNFIRNRAELFETMIKEQGLEFWFRFWLSFCLHNNVSEFNEFEEEVPGWIMTVCTILHNNFVEGFSSKEALRFCWNVILRNKLLSQILSISPMEYKTPLKTRCAFYRQQFAESTSEFVQITFACALGDIFHKWLNTEYFNNGKKYWSIPDRYRDPDFKPGVLEKFLVDKWGIKLTRFFGVGAEQLPWIRQMLRHDKGILKHMVGPSIDKTNGFDFPMQPPLEDRIDSWKSKVKQMRQEIQAVDETRKDDYVSRKHFKLLQPRSAERCCISHSEILLQSDFCGEKNRERVSPSYTNTSCFKIKDQKRNKKRKSSVYAVLKLGCGPNFVRNRFEAFEQMIKEQGVEFWFRFWLTFCFQHGIKEFDEIDDELPGWSATQLKDIHKNFVQGERPIEYCWNVIFETGSPVRRILDDMYQFVAIEFASALGEVFFKWLVADTLNGQAKEYWAIPEDYLLENFRPGPLEKFMVSQWGKRLVQLLGMSGNEVGWIRMLLSQKQIVDDYDCSLEFNDTAKKIRKKYKYVWKLKLKGMRKAIDNADELRKLHQNRAGTKIIKTVREVKKMSHLIKHSSSTKLPQCSCCGAVSRVKKCQLCVDEKWVIPKYYCGISCQSKDWYEKHKKEHYKYMKQRKRVMLKSNAKLLSVISDDYKFISSIES
uniref:MYND-type domain-containing protein n=1 Tax=Strigamia maritima TaxID=126957 RepID=T1J707_STRMM